MTTPISHGALTREQFLVEPDVQDATAYRLLAIGEAAKGLSDDLKSRHTHIPWRQILGMRNILVHDYSEISIQRVWETIERDLPSLTHTIDVMLRKHDSSL